MIFNHINLFRCFIVLATMCCGFDASGVQAPNPRGASSQNARNSESVGVSRATTSRASVRTVGGVPTARGAVVSNAARGGATGARGSKSGILVRSATNRNKPAVASGRSAVSPNVSRASVARATAIYNDVSKIGGGYAACRESYATCMDQFCANANDTYRRCYCSARFAEFRSTEEALDEARTLLMRFEDNNLNAVDKTAAEVNAMYTATVGEAAIKNDTSGAAKMLDEIGDLLSGKKKTYAPGGISNSLGILSFDLSDNIEDIWADGGSSLFGGTQNLSDLDGANLYNAAHKQCMALATASCESSAVANMARSSYSILITQDCNAYQKNLDKKVENIKQTVRTAEKYLREARLEEYRSHNSADVNECITKVRAAITADTACGANYKRCLDYTGAYINQSTGEPIYSPRLFKLTEIINLDGENSDVLAQNDQFNKFLESRKVFAASALDTCRDIQNIVWEEFKRTALIEIAQAQDEKIEEVKMSCVSTMADCYDTQTSALKDFDNTTAQMAGALSAYAARHMCADRVMACASLYGNTEGCTFDGNGKLTAGNQSSDDGISRCGLGALLKFVDTVDQVRIAEGCETAMQNYAKELCTPTSGNMGYPWNCRLRSYKFIKDNLDKMSETYCSTDVVRYQDAEVRNIINRIMEDITLDLTDMMSDQCEKSGGVWADASELGRLNPSEYNNLTAFYSDVFNNNQTYVSGSASWGRCVETTTRAVCNAYNIDSDSTTPIATYDAASDTCSFTNEWYKKKCTEELGGTWEDTICYVK